MAVHKGPLFSARAPPGYLAPVAEPRLEWCSRNEPTPVIMKGEEKVQIRFEQEPGSSSDKHGVNLRTGKVDQICFYPSDLQSVPYIFRKF